MHVMILITWWSSWRTLEE